MANYLRIPVPRHKYDSARHTGVILGVGPPRPFSTSSAGIAMISRTATIGEIVRVDIVHLTGKL